MIRSSLLLKSCEIFSRKSVRPCLQYVYARNYAKPITTEISDDVALKPITFSSSDAGWLKPKKLKSSAVFYPWYKELILWGTYIFVVTYFMYFRPGNDRDEQLSMPLGQRLLKLREQQVMMEKQALIASGNTGSSLDHEMNEIKRLRQKYNYAD